MLRYHHLVVVVWLSLGWPPIALASNPLHRVHESLTSAELKAVFGVEEPQRVPSYEVFQSIELFGHPTRPTLRFEAFGETFDLLLRQQTHLHSPKTALVVRDGNRSTVIHDHFGSRKSCTYQGTLLSHRNVSAAITLCDTLRGILVLPDEFVLVQPLPRRFYSKKNASSKLGHIPHVVFKRSAALAPVEDAPIIAEDILFRTEQYGEFCDVKFEYDVPEAAKLDSLYIFPAMDPLTIELALFLDSELWQHFVSEFGEYRAEDELTNFALAMINNVHVLYQQAGISPNVDLVLVRFEIWKQQPFELESKKHKSGQAQRLLDSFCQYQWDLNPGTDAHSGHWDHAILLTGYDVYHTTTSVAGVAPVARMCDAQYSCSLVEGLHLGRSFVLAHEMGHNLGMVHDGVQNLCSRSCCLMSAVNGAGKTTWSDCSVRELNAYVLSLDDPKSRTPNCLRDNSVGLVDRDHRADGRKPGQRFTADQQCAFFWGRDYHLEIPVGRGYEDICRILWCSNGGSTISTAHPALEGTWCGARNWCIDGYCLPWPVVGPPKPVAGGWSSWARLKQATCTTCDVTGMQRVRKEHRTCDDPAPNNGGPTCDGSLVRGIICTQGVCNGLSKQKYGDRLCTSFRHDPRHGDRQLNGLSYLHHSSPCKVWCHLRDSDLIRNKANFPDGTPCGAARACVAGECMWLSCGGEAVVDREADCPSTIIASWTNWSAWTACSSTCGTATKQRTRVCSSQNTADCTGNGLESSSCNLSPCLIGRSWTPWSAWSPCSKTCGDSDGMRVRTRSCLRSGACTGMFPSFSMRSTRPFLSGGSSLEREICRVPACAGAWSEWSDWSECSRSCSGGQRSRTRRCEGGSCFGLTQTFESCNTAACPVWLPWSLWTFCSVTCGGGERRRARLCLTGNNCPGNKTDVDTCATEPCVQWTDWSAWSECSATCGRGTQRRDRLCEHGTTCFGLPTSTRNCAQPSCRRWTSWGEWSECSKSCDRGLQKRTRICPRDGRCNGEAEQDRVCNDIVCLAWTSWSTWGLCSAACGGGSRKRQRFCQGFGQCPGDSESLEPCNEDPCTTWTNWSQWSQCSATCGAGERRRTRICNSGFCTGEPLETSSCNGGICPQWSVWQSWSLCSTTCGAGVQRRQRTCGHSNEQKIGTLLITDGGEMFVPHNTEEQVAICEGEVAQSRFCDTFVECPASSIVTAASEPNQWTSWSQWTICSSSCGDGLQSRSRFCPAGNSCDGPARTTRLCSQAACPNELRRSSPPSDGVSWSVWSECSSTCGGGLRQRIRFCSDARQCAAVSDSSPIQLQRCNEHECRLRDQSNFLAHSGERLPQWSDWTGWSGCSCFSGQRVRRRFCHVYAPQLSGFCLGPLVDQELCVSDHCDPVSGGWSQWSDWSACSNDCGSPGYRVRHRMCSEPLPSNRGSYCIGQSFEKHTCTPAVACQGRPIHGSWSHWSQWDACSTQCGDGYQARTRFCTQPRPENGGAACSGADFDLRECDRSDGCLAGQRDGGWSSWSAWSGCAQTCGFAFQRRQRVCSEPPPTLSGRPCRGLAFMTKVCPLPSCSGATDGSWNGWTPWSGCNFNCGTGLRTRTRDCLSPPPLNGGLPCFGTSVDERSCTSFESQCTQAISNGEQLDSIAKKWELYFD